MALLGIPFISSPFGHPECHITCGLSSTFAPQQSRECIGGCYCLLPGHCSLSYFSLAYLWAMHLVAMSGNPCLRTGSGRLAAVPYCMVTSRLHSLSLTPIPFSKQVLAILQQDSLLPGTFLPTCLGRCYPRAEGKHAWKFLTWTEAPSQQEGILLTCKILHLSERQSISSQGWYIPRVTQFNKITIMLTHSNQVEKSQGKLLQKHHGRDKLALGLG